MSERTGLERTDRYYLAGFFDGEGSIGIAGNSLSVRVVNTYKPILERFHAAWGGSLDVHRRGDSNSRLCWVWRLYGDNAAQFLADVLPILREKAPQAYLGLHFRSLKPGDPARDLTRNALSLLKKTTHFQ